MEDSAKKGEGTSRFLTRADLERLIRGGLVSETKGSELLSAYRESIGWARWIRFWAGSLGAVFFLAGVIFFFAQNWKEMSPLLRFLILEVAVIASVVGALCFRAHEAIKQWCLVAASVFTGVLIAVYGQVYQTGADAFEVFALWSLLMLAWVVVAKFAPLWMFWLVVAETAAVLYAGQVLVPSGALSWPLVHTVMGIMTVAFLILWELLSRAKPFAWLQGDWIRVMLVTATLYFLSVMPWMTIFDFAYQSDEWGSAQSVGVLAWLIGIVVGTWYYVRGTRSVLSMSLCVLCATVILVCLLGRWMLDELWDNAGGWLIASLLALACFGGATALIVKLARMEPVRSSGAGEVES
ncbi:MAG: DUF2157 domain-containing protein [Verrucomicrobiota bacterium]